MSDLTVKYKNKLITIDLESNFSWYSLPFYSQFPWVWEKCRFS